ncbi:MAG: hypothetical protein INR71_00750 [Terriglobus roseus]|nr:hypothetical protein [Terriglobus roseus]
MDEMLALQSEPGGAPHAAVEDFRKSISRPSGLRGPGFGAAESRIGKVGSAPGLNRSTSSSLASSIARMGAAGR